LREKGPRNRAQLHIDDLALLNAGEMQTRNLMDGLAVDFSLLLQAIGLESSKLNMEMGFVNRLEQCGKILFDAGDKAVDEAAKHKSDTVRGWASYAIMHRPYSLEQAINELESLADDPHFGVREWAWIALRPRIVEEPEKAIKCFEVWVHDPRENIRRFASEATRPRGVCCKHIAILNEKPEIGLPILEPLAADPAKYVQLSVANWLNDASKKNPHFVHETTERWSQKHDSPHTGKIVKRALRSIKT